MDIKILDAQKPEDAAKGNIRQVFKLRRVLSGLQQDGEGSGAAALELLIDRLKTFKTNDEFLAEVAKGPSIG